MMIRVAIPKETAPAEPRVAATPETVKKLADFGMMVVVEKGAGIASQITDADYEAAGAHLAASTFGTLKAPTLC